MTAFEIDKEVIRELAAILKETDLTEIERALSECHIRMTKNSTTQTNLATLSTETGDSPSVSVVTKTPSLNSTTHDAVASPMVGTVYIAPEPNGTPFVEIGAAVVKGDTLFIVEAMKTMNPAPAPISGKVKPIAVTNGAPVEYGELLLIIE